MSRKTQLCRIYTISDLAETEDNHDGYTCYIKDPPPPKEAGGDGEEAPKGESPP